MVLRRQVYILRVPTTDMPLFERINPFLAYIVGLALGGEMARTVYTQGGSLAITGFFSLVATVLIVVGEATHRLEQRKEQA